MMKRHPGLRISACLATTILGLALASSSALAAAKSEDCYIAGNIFHLVIEKTDGKKFVGAEERVQVHDAESKRVVDLVFTKRLGKELPKKGEVYVRGRINGRRIQVPNDEVGSIHRRGAAPEDSSLNRCEVTEGIVVQHEQSAIQEPERITFDPTVRADMVPESGAGVKFADTFKLHGNPNSGFKVYLDFDGNVQTNSLWTSYFGQSPFYAPAAFNSDGSEAFTENELLKIQQIWLRMAEYFSPFNIDVTTEEPPAGGLVFSGSGDSSFGMRVIITSVGSSGGGIAYVGTFDGGSDLGCYVFTSNLAEGAKYIADAAAHEVGHTLGLRHDGIDGNTYYHGNSGWAPVMGTGYYANLVQWSKGEYTGATNIEDDLTIITTTNSGVAFRPEDFGNSFSTAHALSATIENGMANVTSYGVIAGGPAKKDVDAFRFQVGQGGSISLNIQSANRIYVSGSSGYTDISGQFSMLDAKATLYNSAGQAVYVADDSSRTDAVINLANLNADTYYLMIEGAGFGNPLASPPAGYTSYGSIGQYLIRGSFTPDLTNPPLPPPPIACVRAAPTLAVSPLRQGNMAGAKLTYAVSILNNDSADCSPSTFQASAQVPAGWTPAEGGSASIPPGASSSIAVSVASPLGAALGDYCLTIQVSDAAVPSREARAAATYVVTGDMTAPTPVSGLSANFANGAVQLVWNAAQDNVGVVGYAITRNGTVIANTVNTNYSDPNVASGVKYTYGVQALDTAGNRSTLIQVNLTTRSSGGGGGKRK